MSPFRDYQQGIPPAASCRPSTRCALCSGLPAQLGREFAAIVRRSWSLTKIDLLGQAARAALL
jgi:hypothetical protein